MSKFRNRASGHWTRKVPFYLEDVFMCNWYLLKLRSIRMTMQALSGRGLQHNTQAKRYPLLTHS